MKTLNFHYALTVSDENEPLIGVIASQYGWSPTSEQPADGFVMEYVVKEQAGTLLRRIVSDGVTRYFGLKDATTAAAVMAAYDAGAARLTVSIDEQA